MASNCNCTKTAIFSVLVGVFAVSLVMPSSDVNKALLDQNNKLQDTILAKLKESIEVSIQASNEHQEAVKKLNEAIAAAEVDRKKFVDERAKLPACR